MKEITLYRVRKSFNNLKSQKGAFFTLKAAVITARKYGMNVYNNDGKLLFAENTATFKESEAPQRNIQKNSL